VALKLLPSSLTADAQLRARFFREAQLASALDHSNICTIHEVGQSSGRLFIAMQYVEGVTLKQLIGSRPLKLDALLSISLQAADALAAAHDQGIIHRDIKSNNIIATPKGQAKVLDFGLAKLTNSSSRADVGGAESELTSKLTRTGAVMGTPSYMSPEQARGEKIDHRSDIFSLGVVIYEMASGEVPFKRRSQAETMNAVINEPHTPVAEFNEEIPAELSAAIDRALSKEPADRYQSMGELLQDLRRVGRAGRPCRLERFSRGGDPLCAAGAALLAALALGDDAAGAGAASRHRPVVSLPARLATTAATPAADHPPDLLCRYGDTACVFA
jgi:serine/threonine protein kinase